MKKNITEISQKVRAWILWEAGHRTAKSMFRRGKILIRKAERYIADFRKGLDWKRKSYPPRIKRKQTKTIFQKVERKAQNRRRAQSLRSIATSNQISPTTAGKILKSKGFLYSSINKRLKITDSKKKKRVEWVRLMFEDNSVWERIFITDKCSFWLGRSKPNKL